MPTQESKQRDSSPRRPCRLKQQRSCQHSPILHLLCSFAGQPSTHLTPFTLSSQTPLPSTTSKSGLPHFEHLMYVCATSGTKCIASATLASNFSLSKNHLCPHARHFSSAFVVQICIFVFLNFPDFN